MASGLSLPPMQYVVGWENKNNLGDNQVDTCTTSGNAAGMDYVPDTPVCQTCGICEARTIITDVVDVEAVLLSPKGIRGIYKNLMEAEAALAEVAAMGEGYYLIRRHMPEALKSHNLGGGDIPL